MMEVEIDLKSIGSEAGGYLKIAVIGSWYKEEGESVNKGDPIGVVETAKSTVEVEAPVAGIIKKINFESGDEVGKEDVIAVIETEDLS